MTIITKDLILKILDGEEGQWLIDKDYFVAIDLHSDKNKPFYAFTCEKTNIEDRFSECYDSKEELIYAIEQCEDVTNSNWEKNNGIFSVLTC